MAKRVIWRDMALRSWSTTATGTRWTISVLKIDRAFIRDLPGSQKDGAICSTVLDLSRHLDLSVVAEGVETEEQLAWLNQRGCQYIQGYLTGKPMPANVAMAALRESIHAKMVPQELRQPPQTLHAMQVQP